MVRESEDLKKLFHKDNKDSKDISVQIIGHCDPNNQERREVFWKQTY